jgi:hypothetical protein
VVQGRFRLGRERLSRPTGNLAVTTSGGIQTKIAADPLGYVFVNRTGVSFLLGHTELG